MEPSVLHVGRVVEVTGPRIVGELDPSIDDLHRTHRSRRYPIGQVGSIVNVACGDTLVFGIVTSLRMEVEDAGISRSDRMEPRSARWLHVDLFGQGRRTGLDEAIRPDEVVADNRGDLLARVLRIPAEGRPLTIVDLSGVPSGVVDVAVSVLARMIFDFALWNPRRTEFPLLLVCEEAHRYAPRSAEAAFEPTGKALARIPKEGRKYGVSLALVSQRPSELSEPILSRCNTIVSLRLANEQDQACVQRALPDAVRNFVDALPALGTREALVVGDGVTVPLRLVFDELDPARQPRSRNVPFASAWREDREADGVISEAVRRWRRQERTAGLETEPAPATPRPLS